jgi:hypothetical protein
MHDAGPRVLGDLLARERRSNRPALREGSHELDYRRFITTAWKAGNYLRHLGVRKGSTVGIVGGGPPAVLSLLGAAALGATARIDPATGTETDVLVAPTERLSAFDAPARSNRVGYGTEPDDPAVSYFERDVWSENPVEPPEHVPPEAPVLVGEFGKRSHADVFDTANGVADELSADDAVAVRVPLSDPWVVAAGVVAPLSVGACVLLPDESETGTIAVADGEAPEDRTLTRP